MAEMLALQDVSLSEPLIRSVSSLRDRIINFRKKPKTAAPPRPRRIGIINAGNGAHSAAQAGFLSQILTSEALAKSEIAFVVGVSGGALNSGIVARALNRGHLNDERARLLAASNLQSFWQENTLERFLRSATIDFWSSAWDKRMALFGSQRQITQSYLRGMLERHLGDEDTLSWARTDLIVGTTIARSGGEVTGKSHKNHDVSVNTYLASAAVKGYFPAVALPDGETHIDGAYYANPILDAVEALDTVDDLIWIHCNKEHPATDSKGRLSLRDSWENVARLKERLPPCVAFHNVAIDVNLPLWTKLVPTETQNRALWRMGEHSAHLFLAGGMMQASAALQMH